MLFITIATIIACIGICGTMYTHMREAYKERIDYLEDEVFMYKMVVLDYETILEKLKEGVEK